MVWLAKANEPAVLERLIRQVRPAEDFLNLCAAPGQRRLSVAGRLTEVTSYLVPGSYPLIFLTLRNAGGTGDPSQTGADSSLLKIISDFGAGVSASLDLDATLYSILLNVSHLVPSDILEVKIWDGRPAGRPPVLVDGEKETLRKRIRELERKLDLAEKTIEVKELLGAYEEFRGKDIKKNRRIGKKR